MSLWLKRRIDVYISHRLTEYRKIPPGGGTGLFYGAQKGKGAVHFQVRVVRGNKEVILFVTPPEEFGNYDHTIFVIQNIVETNLFIWIVDNVEKAQKAETAYFDVSTYLTGFTDNVVNTGDKPLFVCLDGINCFVNYIIGNGCHFTFLFGVRILRTRTKDIL